MSIAQQPTDDLGNVDLNLPVRAVNRSDSPVTWMYARVKHLLQPGTPTFVPYMAMVYYCGDPRAIDHPGGPLHQQYRRNEYARLNIVHGVYEGEERSWDDVPVVDCYPIDSDVPFNTVLRDPDGVNMVDEKRDNTEMSLMRRSMEEMASKLRSMQAQVAIRESSEAATLAAGFDPADLDIERTTSRALTPEEVTGESMVGQAPVRKVPVPKTRHKAGEGPEVTVDA